MNGLQEGGVLGSELTCVLKNRTIMNKVITNQYLQETDLMIK